jgi:hypothetical protein
MTDEKEIAPVLGWDQPPTSMEGPPPEPDPDHNRRILKEKRFEILTVVGFIVLGTGFLMWRGVTPQIITDAPETFGESIETVQSVGLARGESVSLFGRNVVSFGQHMEGFDCSVDLFGVSDDRPLETALVWLTPVAAEWPPSEAEYQDAVNAVANIAVRLLPSSDDAIERAIETSVFERDADRPHDKGVAGTQDGWKVTYVVFREFDETSDPKPALVLVLQSLDAGSDPNLEALNRELYRAVGAGEAVKPALKSLAAAQDDEPVG